MLGRLKLTWLCCAMALVGCGRTDSPQFKLNLPAMELASSPILPLQRQEIANALAAMFGTPDQPYVVPEAGLDLTKIKLAAGPVWSDQSGLQRGLYRQHCVHCHGVTGDGMGPTSAILNPYPRDYRPGLYKYKSTKRASMPTHDDLVRILRQGVMGTAMPSFDLLAPSEIDALVEYVKYLSLRGQTEIALIQAAADLGEGENLKLDRALLIDEVLVTEVDKWKNATEEIVNPPARSEMSEAEKAESVGKGRELFYSAAKGNCVKCHGPTSLGDGVTNDWDDWNKPLGERDRDLTIAKNQLAKLEEQRSQPATAESIAQLDEQIATLRENIAGRQEFVDLLQSQMLPLRTIDPRNLRLGIYRFGRRPLDLFRRVHEGINGVPMPGGGLTPGFTPEEMWHVVDYVQSLPYESINRVKPDPKIAGMSQK